MNTNETANLIKTITNEIKEPEVRAKLIRQIVESCDSKINTERVINEAMEVFGYDLDGIKELTISKNLWILNISTAIGYIMCAVGSVGLGLCLIFTVVTIKNGIEGDTFFGAGFGFLFCGIITLIGSMFLFVNRRIKKCLKSP